MESILLNPYRINRAITLRDCASAIGSFVPESECLVEGARIVGGMLVKETLDLESLSDTAAIDAAETAGTLKIVRDLTGIWADPTSVKKPGKAYNPEMHSTWQYSVALEHFSVDANLGFWDYFNGRKGWGMLFVFEDLAVWGILDTDKMVVPMDIAMAPSANGELGDSRQFKGTVSCRAKRLPYALLTTVAGFTTTEMATRFK